VVLDLSLELFERKLRIPSVKKSHAQGIEEKTNNPIDYFPINVDIDFSLCKQNLIETMALEMGEEKAKILYNLKRGPLTASNDLGQDQGEDRYGQVLRTLLKQNREFTQWAVDPITKDKIGQIELNLISLKDHNNNVDILFNGKETQTSDKDNVEENIGYIQLFFISKQFRNKGFGKIPMEKCTQIFKGLGVGVIRLCVTESHDIAIKLYSNCGFIDVGKRKGENRIIMEKVIQN